MNTQSDCPNNGDGRHKYYLFKTFVEYEQVDESHIKMWQHDKMSLPIYQKIEYALSSCNCGAAIKKRITDGGSI